MEFLGDDAKYKLPTLALNEQVIWKEIKFVKLLSFLTINHLIILHQLAAQTHWGVLKTNSTKWCKTLRTVKSVCAVLNGNTQS